MGSIHVGSTDREAVKHAASQFNDGLKHTADRFNEGFKHASQYAGQYTGQYTGQYAGQCVMQGLKGILWQMILVAVLFVPYLKFLEWMFGEKPWRSL